MDKFVDIKIRKRYKELLKEYCKYHGYKMYALVEQLIEKNCSIRAPNERNVLRSNE
jgi:hypothetical protein